MSILSALPITNCTDLQGNPLADGYLEVRLSTDAHSPDGQIAAGVTIHVPLDSSGTPVAGYDFWPNAFLEPDDTVYIVQGYEATGQLVFTLFLEVNATGGGFGLMFGSSFAS